MKSERVGLLSRQELDDCIMLQRKGIADNCWRAAHIVKGLCLTELSTVDEKMKRANLYREWRVSGVYGKNTAPCYEKAIAGEQPPAALMAEALCSEVENGCS